MLSTYALTYIFLHTSAAASDTKRSSDPRCCPTAGGEGASPTIQTDRQTTVVTVCLQFISGGQNLAESLSSDPGTRREDTMRWI